MKQDKTKRNVKTLKIKLETHVDVHMLQMKYKYSLSKVKGKIAIGCVVVIHANMTELGVLRRMFGKKIIEEHP